MEGERLAREGSRLWTTSRRSGPGAHGSDRLGDGGGLLVGAESSDALVVRWFEPGEKEQKREQGDDEEGDQEQDVQ